MLQNNRSSSKSPTKANGKEGISPYFTSRDGKFTLVSGDCLDVMSEISPGSVDMIFADPPYLLSNGGITCKSGQMVSVNKGKWDESLGFGPDYLFIRSWLASCQRLLKPDGSIWVSGTSHVIHLVGAAIKELGFKLLNDITWIKPNPPPNLSCRYFTHATETIIWAGQNKKSKHTFNYKLMKEINGNKQMTSVWNFKAPSKEEKKFGKHPTQKPIALLERIVLASTNENDLILDPFSGSATTGLASWKLKRRYLGIERDDSFNRLAVNRFKDLEKQKRESN